MTVQGLQEWLATNGPRVGLLRIDDEVDPSAFEATAILHQLETRSGAPPVLFSAVRALDGSRSPFSLLFNTYASVRSLGAVLDIQGESWTELLEGYAEMVERARPTERTPEVPVQEHRVVGEEVDVQILPWTRHVQMDGGPSFTPIIVSRALGKPRTNLSWNRAMYLDPRHIAVHISPRQLWGFQRDAEEERQDLPVVLVLGHHPAFNLAAAALTPLETDELHVAGALMRAPVAVAPSLAYGEALLIPSHAEVVVEGRLLARRRAVEGPFGEYMRYVGPQKLSHVMEVDAMSWRSDAIVSEIFAGYADHLNAHLSIHASYLTAARRAVPQVEGVAWFQGGGPTTAIISMRKSAEGQPARAAMAVLAASNIVKQVIVVDPDIDIYDSQHVMWAVSSRVRAAEDITILNNLQGNLLDPSQQGYGRASGFIIDATWPLGSTPPPSAVVPSDIVAKHPLEHYTIVEV